MRPTIDHLLDHTARVWRAAVDQDKYGVEEREYVLIGTIAVAINRPTIPVQKQETGLSPSGDLRLYTTPDADVQVRDVLELIDGPDAVANAHHAFEVNQPPTHPRGQHTQIDAIAFNGTLPEVSAS